jgi:hypothetical protein
VKNHLLFEIFNSHNSKKEKLCHISTHGLSEVAKNIEEYLDDFHFHFHFIF